MEAAEERVVQEQSLVDLLADLVEPLKLAGPSSGIMSLRRSFDGHSRVLI